MSTVNSKEVALNEDSASIMSITKSFLASLTEITASIETANLGKSNLHEAGIYLYRVSSVIKVLSESSSDSAIKVLQSLSESAEMAKSVLRELQQNGLTIPDYGVKPPISQLQEIIIQMGKDLSLMPTSAFNEEKCAEIAIHSLSEEMRKVRFDLMQVPETNLGNQGQLPAYLKECPEVESIADVSELYSVSTVVCTEDSQVSDILQIMEALRTANESNQRQKKRVSKRSPVSMSSAQYVEPLYKSFCCPLTDKIMDDPVTIQTGVTFERKAIKQYFENCGDSKKVLCPVTREKLLSRSLSPNIALKNIIQEWKDRNDTARLKVIRAAFSIGSTDDLVLEALKDLQKICRKTPSKIHEVYDLGIIPLLVRLLELRDRNVRCIALEMTRILAEEDQGKEQIGRTPAIASSIRMLSSSFKPISHAALMLLIELSRSRSLSETIGCIRGGVLILIQTKYNRSVDTFASEAADQVLKNMEQCPSNIKLMAENGYLEPLLTNLIEGSEERSLQMVTYLGDIVLEEDSKASVTGRASTVLIQMLHHNNPLIRKVVFKALAQVSTHPDSGRTLVEAGIVKIIVDEMFTKNTSSESADTLREVSAVLANILKTAVGLDNMMVDGKGHTMVSAYVVFNIMYMIQNSAPDDLNLNLIRILYYIAKSTKSAAPVVSAVKESEASHTLVELLNNQSDEIAAATAKLLTLLSPHIGHLLIDKLCKTNGLPQGLVQNLNDPSQITERQALSVCFLAKLPHQNITLNLALLNENIVPRVLQSISEIQIAAGQNLYSRLYQEGLVGILVRFTSTLYDPRMLFLAINHNFTMEFTDLLTDTSGEEVQRLAATGLEKLSAESVHLSKPPQLKKKKFLSLVYLPKFMVCGSSWKTRATVCLVHKGVCSKQNTFCLIEAGAVERLLLCLENKHVKVAEAAMSALSTLLDDRIDIDQSVNILTEMNAIQQVLKALRNHKNETLWQKALWILERFLMKGGPKSLALVSQDRLFSVAVVAAFHHGDAYTRQMAEKILRHLDKMPSLTGTFTM